jgi:nicotinamidase-related amidase
MDMYVTPETLPAATQRWLDKIAPFNQHPMALNVPRSALIVTDMQTFFLDPASPTFHLGGLAILPGIKRLIECLPRSEPAGHLYPPRPPSRSLDSGIMGWWWEGMCIEGSPESEVHPGACPAAQGEADPQAPLLGLL